jgi:hypothetical protein
LVSIRLNRFPNSKAGNDENFLKDEVIWIVGGALVSANLIPDMNPTLTLMIMKSPIGQYTW